jgi:hypothetical protein
MKNILTKLFTILLFILSLILFYLAITSYFFSMLVNLILLVIAIFVLLQGCDNIDKICGLGKYNQDNGK